MEGSEMNLPATICVCVLCITMSLWMVAAAYMMWRDR